MSETKFTKGQWLTRKLFETPTLVKDKELDREWFHNQISIYDPNDNGRVICDVQFATDCNGMGWGYNETTEKWEANALLISKSPQMLEQLHKLAMMCLQSERYRTDTCFKIEVDNSLALIKSATEL